MQDRDPLNANRVPNQIAIQVRDSGVGIDPSRLDQIFPPFRRKQTEETGSVIDQPVDRRSSRGTVIGGAE